MPLLKCHYSYKYVCDNKKAPEIYILYFTLLYTVTQRIPALKKVPYTHKIVPEIGTVPVPNLGHE
jgi:hypothetical protein